MPHRKQRVDLAYIPTATFSSSVGPVLLLLNMAVSRHAGVLSIVLFALLTTALGLEVNDLPLAYGVVAGQTYTITYTPREVSVSGSRVPAHYVR
jgi:hypothetical protein